MEPLIHFLQIGYSIYHSNLIDLLVNYIVNLKSCYFDKLIQLIIFNYDLLSMLQIF